ncbi:DUF3990 domain-containing protein [Roseomonas sp. USHLN139]|uniref:DUF3990 domain-containing protein n=1 Tax=Roseomonas sp. USHLN139 TaxID=3081298 RepID=UPI003B027D9E
MSFWDCRDVLLWHGTTIERATSLMDNGPDLLRSRTNVDFGRGFYATTRKDRAIDWSWKIAKRLASQPAVLRWTVPYDEFCHWPKVAFADAGRTADEFWRFIAMNRTVRGSHRSHPDGFFDIVVGPASSDYTEREAIKELDQVSFHTEYALSLLAMHGPTLLEVDP